MSQPRTCRYCRRQVKLRKDGSGLRYTHYVLVSGWTRPKFRQCRGSSLHGAVPSETEVEEGRKRTLRCPHCGLRKPRTDDFRIRKHPDERGRDCPGWVHSRKAV